MRTRAPVLAALALLLAFAGSAGATIIKGSYTVQFNDVDHSYQTLHGEYVGPYTMTVRTNPVQGGTPASLNITALPCISVQLPVSWGESPWSAYLDDGALGHFGGSTSVGSVTLTSRKMWEVAWLATNYGKWTWDDNIQISETPSAYSWAQVHAAIWDVMYNPDPNVGSGPWSGYYSEGNVLLNAAINAYNGETAANISEDLANTYVFVPVGIQKQPFLFTDSDWGKHHVTPEPGTWALLLMGMALMGMVCRKQRRLSA